MDTATADRPAPAEDGAPAWSAASGLEAYEGYLPTEESPAPEEAAGEEVAASGARPEEVRLEADGPAEQAPAAEPWGGDEEQAWEEAAAREGPLTWLQRIWPQPDRDGEPAGAAEEDAAEPEGQEEQEEQVRPGRGRARQWRQAAGWVQDAIAETEAVLDFIRLTLSRAQPLLDRTRARDEAPEAAEDGGEPDGDAPEAGTVPPAPGVVDLHGKPPEPEEQEEERSA